MLAARGTDIALSDLSRDESEQMNNTQEQFDFDVWAQLAKNDPEAFEAKRLSMIEDIIVQAPPALQQRLRGLQWRIDVERERSKTPLQACIRISNMMWDMIYADRGFLWSLQVLADPEGLADVLPASTQSAEIVQFNSEV